MYEHINEKLSQISQEMNRQHKVDAMLASLREELYALEEKARAAEAVLEKENRDYEKMTEKSLASVIYSVLGSLEERTEKERQEFLDAQLKYNQCLRDLEDVRAQIVKLEAEKRQYKNMQAEYDRLYNEKYRLLMERNDVTAQRIMDLGKRIEQSESGRREIAEAICAGHEVLGSLYDVQKSLDSAEGWGMWDIFGGGMITDMIKHSHIDDADAAARHAQAMLRRFRTELADVHISEDIQIDISGFAKFADFFFDGIISDWFVQSRINATQQNVRDVLYQVQSVMDKLSALDSEEQRIQHELQEQINRLIIEA